MWYILSRLDSILDDELEISLPECGCFWQGTINASKFEFWCECSCEMYTRASQTFEIDASLSIEWSNRLDLAI